MVRQMAPENTPQMVERLFLAVPWGCLRFVIVVFPDHTIFDLTQLFQLREDVTTQRNSLKLYIKDQG